jgi:RimJ/RimL family protein N-acetyltransferase
MAISIRMLKPDEWRLFRDFRLAALQSTPGVYGTRHDDAVTRAEEQWRATVQGPANQSFGLFDGERLIGITSVFTWAGDPSGQTAILASSFIAEAYRGMGLARLLYAARFTWIRTQPQFKRILVGHRLSNTPSRRAIEAHGFRLYDRKSTQWPDGTIEDELFYEMDARDAPG